MPPSGEKLPTCSKMHRRASHVILMHRRGLSTYHRGCVASQRVEGPIYSAYMHYIWSIYYIQCNPI